MKKLKISKSTIIAICSGIICFAVAIVLIFPYIPLRTEHISGLLYGKSIDDMFEQSSLVVYGKVDSKSKSFQIEDSEGGVNLCTDYYIKPIEVLRGDANGAEKITVRIDGGLYENIKYIDEGEPDFNIGGKFVLFLYRPARGGGFNTEGDYYYVSGGCQGAFKNVGKYDTGDIALLQGGDYGEGKTMTEMRELTEKANQEIPIDEEYNKNQFLKNIQLNLENGFMEQEEADRLIKSIEEYATIVK